MKKISVIILAILLISIFIMVGCSSTKNTSQSTSSTKSSITSSDVQGSTQDIEIEEDEITTSFTLVDENGNEVLPSVDNVYTITEAGTYTASGKLTDGQIYVNAPGVEVELDLENVSISNSSVSPIFVEDCDKFTLKAVKETVNYIYDTRTTDYSDTTDETIGDSAVFVKNGNLKVSGKGTLTITSTNNSGIHSKDNVTVKNLTLLIKAMDNGIKGNDKVTIEEDPTIGIVCGNNGIRTSNSEISSKGNQQGYIYILGGTITINSYGDGIDAAYAVEIASSQDEEGNTYTPIIDIYTNIYSSYSSTSSSTASTSSLSMAGPGMMGPGMGGGFNGGGFSGGTSKAAKAEDSAKGIKANEYIKISDGVIFTYTYDDGLHTNNDTLDTGVTASATIYIEGGTLKIKASDDGIHSDGTLNISGGTVYVSESHEGIEGKIINITGGDTTVFGSDDGVNASSQINISGGRLDVTVSSSGDTDGIDSNGTITISGGTVITRGPNQEMAAPIDADGTITVTGGTVIVVGYFSSSIKCSAMTKTTSSTGTSAGDHTVTIGSATITYNNTTSYSGSVTVLGSGSATIK